VGGAGASALREISGMREGWTRCVLSAGRLVRKSSTKLWPFMELHRPPYR